MDRIAELEAEVKRLEFMLDSSKNVAIKRGREIDRLQSHDKEAMELLEAAAEIVEPNCEDCKYHKALGDKFTCLSDKPCIDAHWQSFRWQHADRYEALKAQSNAPTKNTDGEE